MFLSQSKYRLIITQRRNNDQPHALRPQRDFLLQKRLFLYCLQMMIMFHKLSTSNFSHIEHFMQNHFRFLGQEKNERIELEREVVSSPNGRRPQVEGQTPQTQQQAQRSRPGLSERHNGSALARRHAAQSEQASRAVGRLAQRGR